MTAPEPIGDGSVTTYSLLPVVGRCGCPRERKGSDKLPLRVVGPAAELVRNGCQLDPESPVLTYWCRWCKGVVTLTAKDLHLVA